MTQSVVELLDAVRSMSEPQYAVLRSAYLSAPAPATLAEILTRPTGTSPTPARPSLRRKSNLLRLAMADFRASPLAKQFVPDLLARSAGNVYYASRQEGLAVKVEEVHGGFLVSKKLA